MARTPDALGQRAQELAEKGGAPSPHTLASYERRWRQWQAFADFHSISALPADPGHVAAFAVARFRAGVTRAGSRPTFLLSPGSHPDGPAGRRRHGHREGSSPAAEDRWVRQASLRHPSSPSALSSR
jgi:hypothetical protein